MAECGHISVNFVDESPKIQVGLYDIYSGICITEEDFTGIVGGGGSGTSDYNDLMNKPIINGVTLQGLMSSSDIGIVFTATTEEWNSEPSLIAREGAFYVYSDYLKVVQKDGSIKTYPAVKIGDGSSYLIDLPFLNSDDPRLLDHIQNTSIHVTASQKNFWNNKWRGTSIDSIDDENLIFTTD